MNAYTLAMRNYLTVEGRTSRRHFWMFTLIVTVMLLAALVVDIAVFSTPWVERRFLTLLVGAAHIVPFITASVRRLHDADLSGWLYLLNALPFGQLVFIVLACLPPTPGPNKFGEAPVADVGVKPAANSYSVVQPREPAVSPVAAPMAQPAPEMGASVQPMADGASRPTTDQTLAKLEKLAALRAQGVIDDAEFATLKSTLLTTS